MQESLRAPCVCEYPVLPGHVLTKVCTGFKKLHSSFVVFYFVFVLDSLSTRVDGLFFLGGVRDR
jgi:hypothetical protein